MRRLQPRTPGFRLFLAGTVATAAITASSDLIFGIYGVLIWLVFIVGGFSVGALTETARTGIARTFLMGYLAYVVGTPIRFLLLGIEAGAPPNEIAIAFVVLGVLVGVIFGLLAAALAVAGGAVGYFVHEKAVARRTEHAPQA